MERDRTTPPRSPTHQAPPPTTPCPPPCPGPHPPSKGGGKRSTRTRGKKRGGETWGEEPSKWRRPGRQDPRRCMGKKRKKEEKHGRRRGMEKNGMTRPLRAANAGSGTRGNECGKPWTARVRSRGGFPRRPPPFVSATTLPLNTRVDPEIRKKERIVPNRTVLGLISNP
eukprot:scaffold748_cov329-Pavlova_lutheri.AAC.7